MSSKVCSDIYITELQLHNTMLHVVNPAEGYGFRTLTQSDAMVSISAQHIPSWESWGMEYVHNNTQHWYCCVFAYILLHYNVQQIFFCVLKHDQWY